MFIYIYILYVCIYQTGKMHSSQMSIKPLLKTPSCTRSGMISSLLQISNGLESPMLVFSRVECVCVCGCSIISYWVYGWGREGNSPFRPCAERHKESHPSTWGIETLHCPENMDFDLETTAEYDSQLSFLENGTRRKVALGIW